MEGLTALPPIQVTPLDPQNPNGKKREGFKAFEAEQKQLGHVFFWLLKSWRFCFRGSSYGN